jgi:hypothetical protein
LVLEVNLGNTEQREDGEELALQMADISGSRKAVLSRWAKHKNKEEKSE